MVPEYSFDKVGDAAELPSWRAKVRAKLGELLMLPKEIPQLDFKLLKKVRRAYRLAGADGSLRISYYEKYSDSATRKHEEVDLHRVTGLSDDDYLRMSNVDTGQHGFHPDVVMPWLAEVFLGKGGLTSRQKAMIEASVKWPAWQQMPLAFEVEKN